MTDTLFSDVSEFQRPVDDSYPYRVLSIRSNDGTYRDRHFAQNFAWAKRAHAAGKLDVLIVYLVWRPNWLDAVTTHKAMVGTPPAWVVSMIDVESWGGQIRGNQSAGVNGARENLIAWHGGNRRKVIGYANAGDFDALWPTRGDARVVLANYSSNPRFPGKIAHQFSDAHPVPPFGPCDGNSADGLTPPQFAALLGVTTPAPTPTPAPAPTTRKRPKMLVVEIVATTVPKGTPVPGWQLLAADGKTLTPIGRPEGGVNNGSNLLAALGQAHACPISYGYYLTLAGA